MLDKLPPPQPASSVLGDWYVSLHHYGKLQMILAVSERSLLPVVFPGKTCAMRLKETCAPELAESCLRWGLTAIESIVN